MRNRTGGRAGVVLLLVVASIIGALLGAAWVEESTTLLTITLAVVAVVVGHRTHGYLGPVVIDPDVIRQMRLRSLLRAMDATDISAHIGLTPGEGRTWVLPRRNVLWLVRTLDEFYPAQAHRISTRVYEDGTARTHLPGV